MTQEDKDLLYKDLCSRLPYGVMVREDTVLYDDKNTTSSRVKKLSYVHIGKGFSRIKGFKYDYEYIYRPYLFPLDSMTEAQKEDMIRSSCGIGSDKNVFDWYNKNHFDYRGLIPKGSAIDATGLNIYE